MDCTLKEKVFNEALAKIQSELETELAGIAKEAEKEAEQLEQEFDHERDLAQGVGATTGTAIGGAFGGPIGATIGGTIGKTIGSLFTLETSYSEELISLHVPTVTMKENVWKFDIPSVTMRDNDIIFNVPTLVMKRTKGPRIPHSTTRMRTKCIGSGIFRVCTDVPQVTVTWEQTYLDLPTYENREQRIVIGIPEVTMREQRVVVGIPEIRMEQRDIIFRVPSITLTFIKDAGKEMADAASSIAANAARASAQKRLSMKGRITTEVIEPAKAMFECYKNELGENRSKIIAFYDPEIEKLTKSLQSLKTNGVPEDDNDFVDQKKQLDDLIQKRNESVSTLDNAITELDESAKKAIESLLNI